MRYSRKVIRLLLALVFITSLISPAIQSGVPVSAGNLSWTQVNTPNPTNEQLQPGTDVSSFLMASDGVTEFAYSQQGPSARLAATVSSGATSITVSSNPGFVVGNVIMVGIETGLTLTGIVSNTFTINPALTSNHIAGDAVAISNPKNFKMYKSTDAGINWTGTGVGAGINGKNVGPLTMTPDGANFAAADQLGNIYRSTDSGQTFSALPALPAPFNGSTHFIRSLTVGNWYAGGTAVLVGYASGSGGGGVAVYTGSAWTDLTPPSTTNTTGNPAHVSSITVASTAGFPSSGSLYIPGEPWPTTYTSKTATTFDGIPTFGTGSLTMNAPLFYPVRSILAGDVLAVVLSPNHMTDHGIFITSTYPVGTWLGAKLGTNDWEADIVSCPITSDVGTTLPSAPELRAAIRFPSDYNNASNNQVMVSFNRINGTLNGAEDLYRVNGALIGGTPHVYDLNVNGAGNANATNVSSFGLKGPIATATCIVGQRNSTTVMKTTNLMASPMVWTTSTKNPTGDPTSPNTNVRFSPTNNNIYAATSGVGSALSISTDGGVSFDGLSLIDVSGTPSALNVRLTPSFATVDSTTTFLLMWDDTDSSGNPTAGDYYMLFKTTDSAATWRMVLAYRMTSASDRVSGVATTRTYSADHTVYVWCGDTTILKSGDGGNSWAPLTAPANITAFTPVDATSYMTGHANAVYRSGSPTPATLDGETANQIRYFDATNIFVGTQGGDVLFSNDNGTTFSRLGPLDSLGTGNRVLVFTDSMYAANRIVYAGTPGNGTPAAAGVYRWVVGTSTAWELMFQELVTQTPTNIVPDLTVGSMAVSGNGILYAGSGVAGVSVAREVNPTHPVASLSPEVLNSASITGFDPNASVMGLRIIGSTGNTLYATVSGVASGTYAYPYRLITLTDTIDQAPAITAPADGATVGSPVTLSWTHGSPVPPTYAVDVATDNAFANRIAGAPFFTTATSYSPAGLTAGTQYFWKVYVKSGSPLKSKASATRSFTVAGTAPAPEMVYQGNRVQATTFNVPYTTLPTVGQSTTQGFLALSATGPVDPWFGTVAYTQFSSPKTGVAPYAASTVSHSGFNSLASYGQADLRYDFEGMLINAVNIQNITGEGKIPFTDLRLKQTDNLLYFLSERTNPNPNGNRCEKRTSLGGTFKIRDSAGNIVAQGTIIYGTMILDYDSGQNFGWSELQVSPGSAFYDEMVTRFKTPFLYMDITTIQSPIFEDNPAGVPATEMYAVFNFGGKVTPLPKPDLTITEKHEEWVDQIAKTYNVFSTIKNDSTVDITTPFKVGVSIDGTADSEKITINSLAAGATAPANFTTVFTMTNGSDTVVVTADVDAQVGETNEQNNTNTNTWNAPVTTISQAQFTANAQYSFNTSDNAVDNTARDFALNWSVNLSNQDSAHQTISHVTLTADATNIGPITGSSPPVTPAGNIYTFEWDNVPWSDGTVPSSDPAATKSGRLNEGTPVNRTPGYISSRAVNQEVFTTAGTQTVTVNVTPLEQFASLRVAVEQGGAGEDSLVQWAVSGPTGQMTQNPVVGQLYTYTFTVNVTPKTGPVRYIPSVSIGANKDISSGSTPNTTTVSAQVADTASRTMTGTATTSQTVANFLTRSRDVKSVNYNRVSAVPAAITQAQFTATAQYGFNTGDNAVDNTARDFALNWYVNLSNQDSAHQTLSHITLTADAANIGPITGSSPPVTPAGNIYTWEYDNVPWSDGTVPSSDPAATKSGRLNEGTLVNRTPGFTSSRAVNQEVFSAAGTQTVTVNVTPQEQFNSLRVTVENQGPSADSLVQWSVSGPTAQMTQNPTIGQLYTYIFTVNVTPVAGTVRYLPSVSVSATRNVSNTSATNVTTVSAQITDVLPTPRTLSGTGATSQTVTNFLSYGRDQKNINYNRISASPTAISQAMFTANAQYRYSTNDNAVDDTARDFSLDWAVNLSNQDSAHQTLSHITLTADATNIGPITGSSPPVTPAGNIYTWEYDNVPWSDGTVPSSDPAATRSGRLSEGTLVNRTPGYTSSRQVSQDTFTTAGTQTVTVNVTPNEQFNSLRAAVESGGPGEDSLVQWSVVGPTAQMTQNPVVGQLYTYTFTVNVTPKSGTVRYIPSVSIGANKDISSASTPNTTTVSAQVADTASRTMTGTATTSQTVANFLTRGRDVKTVNYNRVSAVPTNISQALFTANAQYSYMTGDNAVDDTAKDFALNWQVAFHNMDSTQQPVSHVTLTADAANIGPITGTLPPVTPAGSIYTWEFSDVPVFDGTALGSDPRSPRRGTLLEGTPVSRTPGFTASRQLSQEIFSAPGVQNVTVKVTPTEQFNVIRVTVEGAGAGEDSLVSWIPVSAQQTGNPVIGQLYTYNFTVAVTPKAGAVRYLPVVSISGIKDIQSDSAANATYVDASASDTTSRVMVGTATTSQTIANFQARGRDMKTVTLSRISTAAVLKDWTFMVYMAADNDLNDAGLVDLNEMEVAGSSDQVNVIALLDLYGPDNTTLYNVQKEATPTDAIVSTPITGSPFPPEVNMGDPATLTTFATWVANHYPANNYALVLWNHGTGWRQAMNQPRNKAIAFDDTGAAGTDYLTTPELGVATTAIRSATGTTPLLLGFDACYMEMVEIAAQIQGQVDLMVGPEETEPIDGWPYNTILTDLVASPTQPPSGLANIIVTKYIASYPPSPPAADTPTMSAINMASVPALTTAVSAFADAMVASGENANIATARGQTEYFSDYTYLDLYDFAAKVQANVSNFAVQTVAEAVKNAVSSAVISEGHGSSHPNAHGISIYLPDTPPLDTAYFGLAFAQNTTWDTFINWYLSPTPPTWTQILSDAQGDALNIGPDIIGVDKGIPATGQIAFQVRTVAPMDYLHNWSMTNLDTDINKTTGDPNNGAEYAIYVSAVTGGGVGGALVPRIRFPATTKYGEPFAMLVQWSPAFSNFEYVASLPLYTGSSSFWTVVTLAQLGNDDGNFNTIQVTGMFDISGNRVFSDGAPNPPPPPRWRTIITDPSGDATPAGSPDITQVQAFRTPEKVGFAVYYNSTGAIYGRTYLDTDQNTATGEAANGIGSDYLVEVTIASAPVGVLKHWTGAWTDVGTVNITAGTGMYSFELPLSSLGNDEGNINIVQTFSTAGFTATVDTAPDTGHGSISEPPWKQLITDPMGDAGTGHDILGVDYFINQDQTSLAFRVRANGIDFSNLQGSTYLDIDQIASTGYAGPNGIGSDFRADIFSNGSLLQGMLRHWTPTGTWEDVGPIPVFKGSGYYWTSIDTVLLMDSDLYMDVVQTLGTATPDAITDTAPDSGFGSIGPRTKDQAINDGLAWLISQQNPDGSWGTNFKLAKTALAWLKISSWCKEQVPPIDPWTQANPYLANISSASSYIWSKAFVIDIGTQPAGNPDTNGNGKGVLFNEGDPERPTEGHATYNTSIVLMALGAYGNPSITISAPTSPISGMTIGQIAQDTVDYLAWSQTDNVPGRGGWNYTANTEDSRSDQSNSGWATLGLAYAEAPAPQGAGVVIPGFVRSELDRWIDYIQNPSGPPEDLNDGGSGYDNPESIVNMLKTGNILQQMAFNGDLPTSTRAQAAIDYQVRHWNDANPDPGWQNNYQATYTTMKGFEAMRLTEIGAPPFDWYQKLVDGILPAQNPDGSWPVSMYDDGDRILATEWALLTLERAMPPTREAPDLTVIEKHETWVDDVAKTSYNINFTIKNKGNVAAAAGTYQLAAVVDNGAPILLPGPALNPGETYTGLFGPVTFSAPEDAIVIVVDSAQAITELNELNNSLSNYWPTRKPDLVIIEKHEQWVDQQAGTYQVYFTVKNIGNAPVAAAICGVGLTVDGAQTEQIMVPVALNPGDTWSSNFDNIPTLSDGTDTIIVTVDVANAIDELDENNNTITNTWSLPTDTTPPTVTATAPANGEVNVAINSAVMIYFSEPMDINSVLAALSISPAVTFDYTHGSSPPNINLQFPRAYSTTYTITIGTGAHDPAGNHFAAPYTFSFTTRNESGVTMPTVTATVPPNNATNVAIGTNIDITFSQAMKQAETEAAFSISPNVAGAFSWSGNTMTFNPTTDLAYSTTYTVTIGWGAQDLGGYYLQGYTFSFTTGTAEDTTPPTITATIPANSATNVAIGTNIEITFSEAMNQASVEGSTSFTPPIAGAYSWAGNTVVFNPDANLVYDTVYSMTVCGQDLAGNPIAGPPYPTFSFTTESGTAVPAAPTDLNATPVSQTRIDLTWVDNSLNETGFTLERSTNADFTVSLTSFNLAADSTSYSDTALVANTTYYYRLFATNTFGSSVASNTASATTPAVPTAPTVTGTSPVANATNVAVTTDINVTFSTAMNTTATEGAFSISPAVNGFITWSGNTLVFNRNAYLADNTLYTVTIGTGAQDLAGIHFATEYSFSFTTIHDVTPPTITSTLPANSATDVAINTNIDIAFSEIMSQLTAQNAFSINPPVNGAFSWSGNTMTFNPTSDLAYNTTYTVTIGTGALDLASIPMAAPYTFSFTTSAAPPFTVTRAMPSYTSKSQTFDVTVTFNAPSDSFNAVGLTDLAPAGWAVAVDIAWCTPVPMDALSTDNKAEYIWAGPYTLGTAFTAVYRVTVPANATPGTYNFPNGTLLYYVGAAGPSTANVTGINQIEVIEGARIQGETWEVKGVLLGGVTLTIDNTVSVVSSAQGTYQLIASATGSHTVVATRPGYRSQTRTVSVTDLGAVYTLDFKANYGLVPNAPDLTYTLACINKWKFPPTGLGLNLTKVLSVINAWKFPTKITLSPTSGPSGAVINITGVGFATNSAGNIWFDSNGDGIKDAGEPQATVTTTATGTFTGVTLTVPSVAAAVYQVRANIPAGGAITALANFTVTQ